MANGTRYPISIPFQEASKRDLLRTLSAAQSAQVEFYKGFCLITTSTNEQEVHEWMSDAPAMLEWVDERRLRQMTKSQYILVNKDWETTHTFRRNVLENNPAIVKDMTPMIVGAAMGHKTSLLVERMVEGTSATCYDGQFFYSAAHPSYYKNETYSNLVTQTGVTAALIKADFETARTLIYGLRRGDGHSLFEGGSLEFHIIHAPGLETAMAEAFDNSYVTGSTAINEWKGAAAHSSQAFLTGNAWYLNVVNQQMKPFIFQDRRKAEASWNFDQLWTRKIALFGVDATYNIGYGFPQLSFKIA